MVQPLCSQAESEEVALPGTLSPEMCRTLSPTVASRRTKSGSTKKTKRNPQPPGLPVFSVLMIWLRRHHGKMIIRINARGSEIEFRCVLHVYQLPTREVVFVCYKHTLIKKN